MNRILTVAGRTVMVYGEATAPCPVVWLSTFAHEGEAVWEACLTLHMPAFLLATIQIEDWNGDLSPWAAPGVFRNEPDFTGHADGYLDVMTKQLLPAVTAQLPFTPTYHAIAGYSLAGLFAVYALYRTEVFSRVASASGSFWYPGFAEFVGTHTMLQKPDAVYLSLGDRESRTRNPIMATVQTQTEALEAHLRGQGIRTSFVLNPGNHFQEPALRMARGMEWMLG